MKEKINKIRHVRVDENRLTVEFTDGRLLAVPLSLYPTLQHASDEERAVFEVYGRSVHWPRLDVDLGIEGLLAGARELSCYAGKTVSKKNRARELATA
ncbi:MAG TPA: DUF2442 domain-containing protein [Verrucomicrobiae bacterium]